MKIRTLALASALALAATGAAFAQSPNGTAGGASKTDTMSKDSMSKDTMAKDKMKSGTTGMSNRDAAGATNNPKTNANVSPASPNAGEKQEK